MQNIHPMLHRLRNKAIWRLKRLPVLDAADDTDLKNRWEEFCWHYYGDSITLELWDDYVVAEISTPFEKLKETDRFQAWLETRQGKDEVFDFLIKKFESYLPIEYLNIDRLCHEINWDESAVFSEVYDLIKAVAWDYACDHDLGQRW